MANSSLIIAEGRLMVQFAILERTRHLEFEEGDVQISRETIPIATIFNRLRRHREIIILG